jgi:multiple sugar transport system substrate-binding protein
MVGEQIHGHPGAWQGVTSRLIIKLEKSFRSTECPKWEEEDAFRNKPRRLRMRKFRSGVSIPNRGALLVIPVRSLLAGSPVLKLKGNERTMKKADRQSFLRISDTSTRMSRRNLMRGGGAAGLGAAGLFAMGPHSIFTPSVVAQEEETRLAFIAGSYESGLVRENLDRFEEQYPGLKVDFTPEADGTYLQKMTVVLSTGGMPVDVMYVGDEQLATWAEAGWLLPIDDFPETEQYKQDLFPFNLQSMSYNGKLYGLPYYSDFQVFAYNEQLLNDAGFSSPPATWDEVVTQAQAAREAGVVSGPAMVTGFSRSEVNSFQLYWSMVFGSGGDLFDEELNPIFPDEDVAALEVLEWLVSAINDWEILDRGSIEMNLDQARDALAAGQVLFADMAKYDLQRLNDPEFSQIAGLGKMAPFPKFSADQPGGSFGWARMHSIPTISEHPDEAWKLLQYAAGKDAEGEYYTAKMWATLKGLGTGWRPLLDDEEVILATQEWGDIDLIRSESALVKGRNVLQAPWYAEWEQFFYAKLQEALLERTSPREALQESADKAIELKQQQES